MPKLFFTQKPQNILLKPEYLPESFSLRILRLMDADNNYYAMYKSDFLIFSKYLREQHLVINELTTAELVDLIDTFNQSPPTFPQNQLRFIKYFSPEYLSQLVLDPAHSSFTRDGIISTVSGLSLIKNGHQNCIVMHQDGSIYVHPKIRGGSSLNHWGVNHPSLAPLNGSPIAFAGSFVHTSETGWVLENTTGHYGTRATQMRHFVAKLKEMGCDLASLTIKLWIPNNPKNPGDKEINYTLIKENAELFLKQVSKNLLQIRSP
jgi:hypothetical protein